MVASRRRLLPRSRLAPPHLLRLCSRSELFFLCIASCALFFSSTFFLRVPHTFLKSFGSVKHLFKASSSFWIRAGREESGCVFDSFGSQNGRISVIRCVKYLKPTKPCYISDDVFVHSSVVFWYIWRG